MLSKDLAKQRAALIAMDKASCKVLPSEIRQELDAHGRETIYMSVVDKEGNIVSLIQSNYSGYGTGMVAPGAGFSFHNRGAGFDLEPGKPNSLAGHKRPLHTIIPAFMRKGDLTVGFGIMGGWNQSQAHAQFVANVVDFGMNVQMALEAARFTKGTFRWLRRADGVAHPGSRPPGTGEPGTRDHTGGPLRQRHGQRRSGHARRQARGELWRERSADGWGGDPRAAGNPAAAVAGRPAIFRESP